MTGRRNVGAGLVGLAAGLALTGAVGHADAHGIFGHMHVTGWAIESLPEGELREFFSDPEVMNAALFGAAFTDSGYWPQGGDLGARAREYGEHTHWEPYVNDYVEWMLANDPAPFDDLESKRRVAFLMGCAAHGLQDEIFDSLFLYQVEEHDNGSQDNADPGTDGFLSLDGYIRWLPTKYYPEDVLLELYADLGQEITADTIQRAVDVMVLAYVNPDYGAEVAAGQGELYADELVWTRDHYLDPSIPGSLASEIPATAAYMQAIWDRLHGRRLEDSPVVFHYPSPSHRLVGESSASPDSWVTLIYGVGVAKDTEEATWLRGDGTPIVHTRSGTRWGADWARVVRFHPTADLTQAAEYSFSLAPGLEMIDGTVSREAHTFDFQVACADAADPACAAELEPVGYLPQTLEEVEDAEEEPVEEVVDDAGSDAANGDAENAEGAGETPAVSGDKSGCAAGASPTGPVGVLGPAVGLLLGAITRRRKRHV